MDAQQLFTADFRRFEVTQQVEQTRGNQPILDRPDPTGRFRMTFPGIVLQAPRVAYIGGFQGVFRFP
jgi:hypothetical protein